MPGIESTLPDGWERSETTSGIPYYIDHETECTYWDHPEMVKLLQEIAGLNNIKYAAYRTAMKLRAIQKKTQMHLLDIPVIITTLQEEDVRDCYTEKKLTASEMHKTITAMFINQNGDRTDFIDIPMASDLTFNWILSVFDQGRTGFIPSISLKVGLSFMCAAKVQDKYKYIFRQLCNSKGCMDSKRLNMFLQEALQIPRNIYEGAVFSGTSVEPAVRNCFERTGAVMDQLNLEDFLHWMIAEPQTIVWLPTLHRLAVSESVKHESKCNICKMYPIVGFRYRCLKCFNFDICQECFWLGRTNKGHKIGHPTQEYCLASSQKEDMKDFAKVMRNKVSKKKKPTDPSKGRYISIANEDAGPSSDEEYPADGPPVQPKFNAETHSKLGSYAARLADYDEIDSKSREQSPRYDRNLDEESLHRYPASRQRMSAEPPELETSLQLRNPAELPPGLDLNQRDDLEDLISNLEDDNRELRDEINHIHQLQLQNLSLDSLQSSEEAERLRQRKERLLAREEVLESHNHQLEVQLNRLRSLLHQDSSGSASRSRSNEPSKHSESIRSVTIPYQPSPFPKVSPYRSNTTDVPGRYITPNHQEQSPRPPVNRESNGGIRGAKYSSLTALRPSINQESNSGIRGAQYSSLTALRPPVNQESNGEIRGAQPNTNVLFNDTSFMSASPSTRPPVNQEFNGGIRRVPSQTNTQSTPVMSASPSVRPPVNQEFNAESRGMQSQTNTQSTPVMSAPPATAINPSRYGFNLSDQNTSYEEAELQNIVHRMTSSFPLNAESDISMEIHNDLFLAASMVGEAMQSLVSAVARQGVPSSVYSE